MSLTTERLILRQWRDEDVEPFATMSADPAVMEFLLPIDRARCAAFAAEEQAYIAEHGFGWWVIELPGKADFIGFAGLSEIPAGPPFPKGAIEIAWRLARPYWGQGYATEAACAALEDGFGRLGFDEIVAITTPMNRRSRAVMERLGMIHDEAGDFEHPRVPEGHRLRPHVLYRLPRAAWAAQA
jgi:RimJ/RimL family protein N-acetyltransferase